MRMKKIVLFAFRGESMCFVHVMLNALDMKEKGYDVKIVLEGEAVKLVKELEENPLFKKTMPLIDCVCRARSKKMGVLEYNEASPLNVCGDMSGHPSMSAYIAKGYDVIAL